MAEEHEKTGVKSRFTEVMEDIGLVVYRALQGMWQSNVTIMASGLVYSTLVAIVPCITFFMAFLTVFGLIQPFMETLGAFFEDIFGPVLGGQLMGFVNQFSSNAMGLGIFGLVSFIITAVFLVNKVYNVLNQIFRTQPSTGNFRRFTNFLTFLIVGVVFLALAFALSSSAIGFVTGHLTGSEQSTNSVSSAIGTLVSIIVTGCVLFLVYYFVPNAKVRSRSALLGSAIAAIALAVVFALFKLIVATAVSYSVIYGSLASLFFVLLFLYVCWYIILTSAEVIYVHQFRPETSQLTGGPENPSRQVADAVNMMMLIGRSYKNGEGPISRKNITRRLAITPGNLTGYISLLVKSHLIIEISDGKAASYVPSRPLDQILIREIFDAIYGFDPDTDIDTAGEAVAEQVKASSDGALSSLTLENLLERI